MLRILLFAAGALLLPLVGLAQTDKLLAEGENWQVRGLTLGYRITNVRKQEVKKENFDRYEITAYVYNEGGCEVGVWFTGNERQDQQLRNNAQSLVIFECVNATGARLTSKSSSLGLEPRYFTHRWTERNAEGKEISRSQDLLVGYHLPQGRRRESRFIVIVPEGQAPNLRAVVNF
ncbi:MAG: hypothetical protein MUC97_09500 [Bernardetiaceae bacterium]|jgi:hypothetical protein|nr:hypothetical protein [Bernardetiaceae bacterium]